MVEDLIDKQLGRWDLHKLQLFFLPEDVEAILSIPLSIKNHEDSWQWHYDKKGWYTVKSGYKLAFQQTFPSSTSNEFAQKKWWKTFWNQNIPPKVKIFTWRSFFDALPTLVNLSKRKVCLNWLCPKCGKEAESINHTLLFCAVAKEVWSLTPFAPLINSHPRPFLQECFLKILNVSSTEGLSCFCMILWCLWWNKNEVVHAGSPKSSVAIIDGSYSFLSEFCRSVFALSPSHLTSVPLPPSSWIPLPPNCLKLNIDVALKEGLNKAGLGAVIRDSNGWIIGAISKVITGNFSAEISELLALRKGLFPTSSLNLKIWVVEVDAYNVASCVSSVSCRLDDASCIISDIKDLCKDLGFCKCVHIPKKGNAVAHSLAKMALSSNVENSWLNCSLSCIPSIA